MRPCRQCRAPIENNVKTCPHCGAVQIDEGPRATPTPDQPPPGLLRRLIVGAVKFEDPFLSLLFFVIPIVLGGAIGYSIAGTNGAVLGLLCAFLATILFTVLMAAGDSGG
jgi:hypothetical protein